MFDVWTHLVQKFMLGLATALNINCHGRRGTLAMAACVLALGTFPLFSSLTVPAIMPFLSASNNSVIDCYLPIAPELLLLVNGLKQVFAFGFAYGVAPWIAASGYKNTFGTIAGINCGVMLLTVPMWYYGRRIRHISAKWKLISW